jgi:hypothetical protein
MSTNKHDDRLNKEPVIPLGYERCELREADKDGENVLQMDGGFGMSIETAISMPIGTRVEVRAARLLGLTYTPWIPAIVVRMDPPIGFFVNIDGPHGRQSGVFRRWEDEGEYWRKP